MLYFKKIEKVLTTIRYERIVSERDFKSILERKGEKSWQITVARIYAVVGCWFTGYVV